MSISTLAPYRSLLVGVGLIAAICIGIEGLNYSSNARRLAYEQSPEGRAEAAQKAAQDEEQAEIEAAETLVQSRLRDPESATFMGTKVVQVGKEKGVCGFVNAKNAFGGMAGDQWFLVVGIDVSMADDGPRALDRISHICG